MNRIDHHCPYDPGSEFDRVQEHHLHFDRASEEDGTESDDRFQAILAVAATGGNWPITDRSLRLQNWCDVRMAAVGCRRQRRTQADARALHESGDCWSAGGARDPILRALRDLIGITF